MSKSWAKLTLIALFLGAAVAAHAQSAKSPVQGPDDIVLGKPDAPITIFEYASLSCPHCAEFDKEILPQIKKDWIDTGKARLIFRDFPLNAQALHAAVLAHCAPADEFYPFVDLLFGNQDTWLRAEDIDAALGKLGVLGGVTPEKFAACQADKPLSDKILSAQLQASHDYDVSSTPTFFINGHKIEGALPYTEFAKTLNDLMPKS